MKTLGMIGGTSWHSTIVYYRLINELTSKRIGSEQNPPLLLYSLNVNLLRLGDWDKINEFYLGAASMLENAGAEAILICANTPHKVYDFVSPKLGIPILHIADATSESAISQHIKQPGLLGTQPTMEEKFLIGRMFEKYSIECLVPEESNRNKVHQIIVRELTQGQFIEKSKQFLIEEMDRLKTAGADGIILGCTELPLLIKKSDFDLPLLDTTYLHAQMAVEFILADN